MLRENVSAAKFWAKAMPSDLHAAMAGARHLSHFVCGRNDADPIHVGPRSGKYPSMAAAAIRQGPSAQVLIVDDDPRVCETLTDLLEVEGFEPVCVSTDRQAYEALRRHTDFACLVVDINLGPGTTGFDVARTARQLDPSVAVIYISGDATEASFRANGVPGSRFLEKPFTPSELMAEIEHVVGTNDR